MDKRVYSLRWVGLLGVSLACSSGGGAAARVAPSAPVARIETRNPVAHSRSAAAHAIAAPEYHDDNDADRVFIENAERAIGEYTRFLARAGEADEYAHAVKRSREQMEDLRAEIEFVRAGRAQRAVH